MDGSINISGQLNGALDIPSQLSGDINISGQLGGEILAIEGSLDTPSIIFSQLSGDINISGQLNGSMDIAGQLSGSLDPGGSHIPPYEGDYIVDPHVYEQVLETNHKRMLDNVLVKEILLSEVVNPQGGTTLIIE